MPWGVFLDGLRERRGALTASWILRAGADRHHEAAYRERHFARDPFLNLPEGEVVTLADLLPEAEVRTTDFFRHFLEPAGVPHVMGVDLRGGVDGRLCSSRGREGPAFPPADRALLAAPAPHALRLHARITRAEGERDAYASTIRSPKPACASQRAQLGVAVEVEEAAAELGIARSLRTVFDSAGVSRQAELVRSILRSDATLA